MTKDLNSCVFHADDWLLRSSESLAYAASEARVRFTSMLTVNKHLMWLRWDNNPSRSTLNKQEEHQQQRDDPPVKGKVHLHALLIISLEKHNCDAMCDHHPNVVRLRRAQFVSSVAPEFIVLLKLALTMLTLSKRCTDRLLRVCIVQGCI